VPSDPPQAALSAVEVFCESNVLEEMRDELRLECSRRGNSITVVEGRPPWNPELIGTEWTSMNVAQLRYNLLRGTGRPIAAIATSAGGPTATSGRARASTPCWPKSTRTRLASFWR
jgi:hypothetical protein